MADEKEIILEISVEKSIEQLAKLQIELEALRRQREQFEKDAKNGDIDAAKEVENRNTQLRNLGVEYKAQQRILDGYNNTQKAQVNTSNLAANSIQTNRDLLKQLTAQYIQLKNPSANATAQIKHLSDTLKGQEAAIGNTSRNVGNYREALNGVLGSLTSTIPGLRGVALAQEGVNAAMASNPIGLVVVGFQVLLGVLTSFKPVVEAVEKATAGLSAGFSALINGGNMVEAANEAARLKQELNDLEDAQNGVTIANAEFDAKINLLLKQLRNKSLTEQEASKISEEIAKLADARFEKNRQQQEAELKNAEDTFKFRNNLSQKELDALVERGKTKDILDATELERLKRLSKDTGIAEAELIKNAEEAQVALAEIAERKIKGDQKAAEEEIKSIAAQRAAIIGLADARDQVQQTVDNRNAALSDRFKAEREKAENEAKRVQDKEIKRLEQLNIANEKALSKIRENAILQLEIQKQTGKSSEEIDQLFAQSKLRDFKEFGAEQLRIQKEINEESKRIQQENENNTKALTLLRTNAALQLELQRKTGESQEEIDRQFQESGLASFKEFYDKKKTLYETDTANAKKAAQEQQTLIQAGLSFISNTISSIAQAVQESNTRALENDRATNDAAQENLKRRLDAGEISKKEYNSTISKMDSELRQKEREANQKAWETNKAIQITMAVINTAQAIIAQLSNPTPYVGIALAALAAATGATQIGIIAAQQPPKFAKGVIGLDGDGTETSDSIDAKLSRGESVMTAKATKRFHRELVFMEMAVGNSPNYQFGKGKFATGFIPNIPQGDGGFTARDIARNSDTSAFMRQAIMEGFSMAPAPVLSIVELNSKQDSRNRSIRVSEA